MQERPERAQTMHTQMADYESAHKCKGDERAQKLRAKAAKNKNK